MMDKNVQVSDSPVNGAPAIGSIGRKENGKDQDIDILCGCGSWRPNCLQVLNKPKITIIWLSWFAFLQGFLVNGVNNVNTSTLERRFKLKSSEVGWVSSAYDISACLFVLPITFYGTHGHQPRMLAFAAFIMALGSITMSLPHFITGPYELGERVSDTCGSSIDDLYCSEQSSSISKYMYVLMLGQFLHGIGGTTLYTLGFVFIDSNFAAKDSPMYQGIMMAFSALGPAFGYLLGGQLLNIYVDWDSVDPDVLGVTPSDPRWVGSWWLGFITAGCLLMTVFTALILYPRKFPAQADNENAADDHEDDFMTSWRDIPSCVYLILSNPVLMCATLVRVIDGIASSGFSTFMPKFIQNQFSQSASWSAMLTGLMVIPGASGGLLVGGAVIKYLNLDIKGMLRMCTVLSFASGLLMVSLLIQCRNDNLAGISVGYQNDSVLLEVNLTSSCNVGCKCTSLSYEPVCGVDGVQYFSPCHCGCLSSKQDDQSLVYSNCSCVDDIQGSDFHATEGPCKTDCTLLYAFLPLLLLLSFLLFMTGVPTLSLSLRSIPANQRAFALGVQWVFVRCLGTIPGPILFGHVVDSSCVQWQDTCSGQGSCWVYDNTTVSRNTAVLGVIVKVVSVCVFIIAYHLYNPHKTEAEVHPAATPADINDIVTVNTSNESRTPPQTSKL